MAKPDLDKESFQPLAGIDKIIHEPARLMLMAYLYVIESADFLFLERQTGLTRGNLSSHMAKLEDAGYVDVQVFLHLVLEEQATINVLLGTLGHTCDIEPHARTQRFVQ